MMTKIEAKMANQGINTSIIVGAISGATIGLFIGIIWGLGGITVPDADVILIPTIMTNLLISIAAGIGIGAVLGSLLLTALIKLGFYTQRVKPGTSPFSVLPAEDC